MQYKLKETKPYMGSVSLSRIMTVYGRMTEELMLIYCGGVHTKVVSQPLVLFEHASCIYIFVAKVRKNFDFCKLFYKIIGVAIFKYKNSRPE